MPQTDNALPGGIRFRPRTAASLRPGPKSPAAIAVGVERHYVINEHHWCPGGQAMAEKRAAPKRAKPRAKVRDPDAEIVETALDLAELLGWEAVRLHEVAARLDIPMSELLARYRDKDAIADAWFARATAAMLDAPPSGFEKQPPESRLHLLMMRWFDALAGHREVTGQMLGEKLYPAHPHHWVPAIFNLSRTIQWLRDAALLDARGRRRQIEEIGLSVLFLATFRFWLDDESMDQTHTREFLSKRLAGADRFMARWCRGRARFEERDESS
jgi:AcrR family transcriptional regulator